MRSTAGSGCSPRSRCSRWRDRRRRAIPDRSWRDCRRRTSWQTSTARRSTPPVPRTTSSGLGACLAAYTVARDGRAVGYAYVQADGSIGPIAVLDSADLAPAVEAAIGRAAELGRDHGAGPHPRRRPSVDHHTSGTGMALRRRRHAGAQLSAMGPLGSVRDIGRRRPAVIDTVLRNATILDGTGGPRSSATSRSMLAASFPSGSQSPRTSREKRSTSGGSRSPQASSTSTPTPTCHC